MGAAFAGALAQPVELALSPLRVAAEFIAGLLQDPDARFQSVAELLAPADGVGPDLLQGGCVRCGGFGELQPGRALPLHDVSEQIRGHHRTPSYARTPRYLTRVTNPA